VSKKTILLFTLLFIMLMSAPVMANVTLDINGKSFEPGISPQLENGITTVPLSFIARSLGADAAVDEQGLITINENGEKLVMSLGSTGAVFNGNKLGMPKAPEKVGEEIMLPVRFVMETFGAEIGWQDEEKKVTIDYEEKRNGMTVEEMLATSSANLDKCNTYKMNMDMEISMDVKVPEEEAEKIDMSSSSTLAFQKDPLTMYIQQSITAVDSSITDDGEEQIEEITSESLVNEDGYYLTMPETGWLKMELPGLDIQALMEQSGNQNPVSSIQEMKDYGVILSYGNDQEKNGEKYWLINVTMGPDSFTEYCQSMMGQVPFMSNITEDAPLEMQSFIESLMNSLEVDMVYDVWIDQEELLPTFMDLDARMFINMQFPLPEDEAALSMEMNMTELVFYEIYDLELPFEIPDVSGAKDFMEAMQEEMNMSDIEVK